MEELIPIFLFLSVAAVLIFRPISKKLGLLLEEMARDRRALRTTGDSIQMERVTTLLERMNTRLEMVEDRLEFVERLSDSRTRSRAHLSGVSD